MSLHKKKAKQGPLHLPIMNNSSRLGEYSQPEGLSVRTTQKCRGSQVHCFVIVSSRPQPPGAAPAGVLSAPFFPPGSPSLGAADTRAGPSSSLCQAVRISTNLGQNGAFLHLLSVQFCDAREGDLKACGTCAQQRGCGCVCRRTELLIKTARSDAIERLVVTLC